MHLSSPIVVHLLQKNFLELSRMLKVKGSLVLKIPTLCV